MKLIGSIVVLLIITVVVHASNKKENKYLVECKNLQSGILVKHQINIDKRHLRHQPHVLEKTLSSMEKKYNSNCLIKK